MSTKVWGESALSRLFYRSREHQTITFEIVQKHLPAGPQHLLDFGCGYGDFCQWIPEGYTYLGVDDDAEVIESARELYPGYEFECSRKVTDADVIVAIGAVTCEIAPRERLIRSLLRHSRLLIVVVNTKMWPDTAALELFPHPRPDRYESCDDFICIVTKGRL